MLKIAANRIGAWAYGYYAWAVSVLILLLCGGLILLVRRPPVGRRIARFGARLLFALARMPLAGKGLERLPPGPHILLPNHTSFLDGLVLIALLPPRPGYAFTVRQEFDIQRLLCPLLRGVGTLVLHRPATKPGASNVDRITAALRRGERLVIFPEGGFVPEPGLQPFHSGAFVAAANAGVPIVVAGLRGARAALRPRTWLPRRVAITLEIGPVLQPAGNVQAAILRSVAEARSAMEPLSGEVER